MVFGEEGDQGGEYATTKSRRREEKKEELILMLGMLDLQAHKEFKIAFDLCSTQASPTNRRFVRVSFFPLPSFFSRATSSSLDPLSLPTPSHQISSQSNPDSPPNNLPPLRTPSLPLSPRRL